jgi:phage gp16-like protein
MERPINYNQVEEEMDRGNMIYVDAAVVIGKVDNGFVVKVGCKQFAFKKEEADTMAHDLVEYLTEGQTERLIRKYRPDFDAEVKRAEPPRAYQEEALLSKEQTN